MPDIKDVYNVVSKSNLFVDENDFRNQIASNPKEVFDFISKNKNTQGLFIDFNDFQDNLKKKVGGVEYVPIPSRLPFKDVLEQGQEMVTRGFAVAPKQISTELSEVEESINKVKKAYDALEDTKASKTTSAGMGAPGFYDPERDKIVEQNYTKAKAENDRLLKSKSKEIYSSVDDLLLNNGFKNLFENGVFNTEKARGILDEKIKAKGGGSFLRETALAELKKRAQSDYDKPAMDKFINEEAKKAGIDINSIMSKQGKNLFAKMSANQQSILPVIKQEAEKEATGILDNAKQTATELGNDFSGFVADLNAKINNGQVDQQTAQGLYDQKKSEYDNGLAQLNQDYQKMVRDVNVRVNNRFGRIENELKKISGSVTSAEIFKNLPKEDAKKINEVYNRAAQRLADSKNTQRKAADMALGLPAFATKSLISGFNKGLSDIGGYLQMNGTDNKFIDFLLNRGQTADETAIGQYDWNGKEWFKRALGGTMQSMGASAPTLLPTLGVGLATQGLGAIPMVSALATGYAGYKGEAMQNAGDAYMQKLAETGSVNKAYESASRVEKANQITLPFYFLGGLGTMKLLQGGGKIGSFLVGGALEQAEEIPTEYIQEYNQAKENGYTKGIGSFIKENPEIAADTFLSTIGQSGVMSAVGKALSKIDAASTQPTTQFYADLVKNQGLDFANIVLQNYYNTGVINEKQFEEQKIELQNVAQSMQKVQDLGVSPEKAQVITVLNANVEALKADVEAEQDQAAKSVLEGKLRQAQADLKGISNNTTPYIVLTLPGGQNSTRIMTMQEYEQLKQDGKINDIIKAADKVQVVNDEELNTEISQIKKEVGIPEDAPDGAYKGNAPAEELEKPDFSQVLPYVIEDREKVEPILEKINNGEVVNEEDLYNAAQVLENLQSKTNNKSLKNLINPVIDKILTYENQSKTTVGTVTQKGAITRVGVDVGKKTVSKAIGQFEGSRATLKDRNGKTVSGYLKLEDGNYNLYNEDGNKVASIGEKQITDRDVVLPSTDVVPRPIELDENGNVKSITLQLQKVNAEIGVLPDRLITIEFKNPEKGLDYAIQLRAEQVGEFSDPEFEEIITQVKNEELIPAVKLTPEQKAEQKRQQEAEKDAAKKKEVKDTLINLRNAGVLVTADKSILGKVKRAVGIKPIPMTDAEIDAQMSLLDAMAKVWKQTTGLDNFYDTFISDIQKGDVAAFKNKGGVLFQDIENPSAPVSRVTLAVFEDVPQFQKMVGQMVNPQSIADLMKGKGKQIEKDIITDVLNFEKYKGLKRISFDDFRDDVETQIMKLEKIKTNSYADYGEDNLGGNEDYGNNKTIIFNAPIDHGETGHFSGDFKGFGLKETKWELKQIPGTDTWVAMDENMPSDTPQTQIQNYVGTAGTEANVKRWIEQREFPAKEKINIGLFGHIRRWFNKDNGIYNIAELQSDVYQKYKASELISESVPEEEIDAYMNKNFYSKLNKEYTDKIVKNFKLKVIPKEDIKNLQKEIRQDIGRYEREISTTTNTEKYRKLTLELDKLSKIDRGFNNAINYFYNDIFIFDNKGNYITSRKIIEKPYAGMNYGEQETYQSIMGAIDDLLRNIRYGDIPEREVSENNYYVKDSNGDYDYFVTKDEQEKFLKDLYGQEDPIEYYRNIRKEYNDNELGLRVEKQKYVQQRIEEQKGNITPMQKQFIASQKFHELRLLREAFKDAAESGAKTIRFPSPYTIAVIEGYVNKSGESGMPYEIIEGNSDRLESGDIVRYGDDEYYVLDSDRRTITVAPKNTTYEYDVDSFRYDEKVNRISEIEYEAKKHFNDMKNITLEEIESYEPDEYMGEIAKKLLEEEFQTQEGDIIEEQTIAWDNIEKDLDNLVYDRYAEMDLDDLFGWGYPYYAGDGRVFVAESRGQIETLNQPDEYDSETKEEDFEKQLSSAQTTVVNKYKELNELFRKLRPDAISVRDDNDMEWVESEVTASDVRNPIIAFQNEGGNIKGAIDFVNDNKASVYVFNGADISTLAHEFTGHLGRRFLDKLAETDEGFKKDYDAVKKWASVEDNKWGTRSEEMFARGFERYLREGKAPTKSLKAVFENLKNWLTQIYKSIVGSSIDIELTPEVKEAFGNLLGGRVQGTLAEEYENIPKDNKLSAKNAVKTLINDNFEEIKKQLENKKICQ